MQLKSFYFHFLCVTSVPTVVHIFSQAYYFSHKHGRRSLWSPTSEKKTKQKPQLFIFYYAFDFKRGCLNCSINKDHFKLEIRITVKQKAGLMTLLTSVATSQPTSRPVSELKRYY